MIVIDANLLLYAYVVDSKSHEDARRWLESAFSGDTPVLIPWHSIAAFIRIGTNPRLPGRPMPLATAVSIVDLWLAHPNVRVIGPGIDYWRHLRSMLLDGQAFGPLATDAELAALTIGVGGILHSTDRDFARFPGLRWKNPLV